MEPTIRAACIHSISRASINTRGPLHTRWADVVSLYESVRCLDLSDVALSHFKATLMSILLPAWHHSLPFVYSLSSSLESYRDTCAILYSRRKILGVVSQPHRKRRTNNRTKSSHGFFAMHSLLHRWQAISAFTNNRCNANLSPA